MMQKAETLNAIDFATGTHVGLVRELNEDSLLAVPEQGLWVVADGMGGHQAGDVASAIAVETIALGVKQGATLIESVEMAHRAIQKAAFDDEASSNMGSTVVVAKLNGLHYEVAWVGDSRAYLWNGSLRRLTTDHSYVQMLLAAGVITEDEVAGHPARNVISQGLGVGGVDGTDVEVDVVSGELADGDILVLCSDGLNGQVQDQQIAAILSETSNIQDCVSRLIDAALEAGGKDNVTVILIDAVIG